MVKDNFLLKICSYSVHLLTVIGLTTGFLALLAVLSDKVVEAFLWLALSFFIDGIDGPLSRWLKVKERSPNISGKTLDHIVDYFNYVFIPAFMIYWLDLVPIGTEFLLASIIMLSSCYTFSNINLKTDDNYFTGFPALWNLVVFYFFLLETSANVNVYIILILSVLIFIPIKFLHPFRVKKYRALTLLITLCWSITSLLLLLLDSTAYYYLILSVWVLTNCYFLSLSLLRTLTK